MRVRLLVLAVAAIVVVLPRPVGPAAHSGSERDAHADRHAGTDAHAA